MESKAKLATALLILLPAVVAAGEPLRLVLDVSPAVTIAGVPVNIHVSVTNPSTEPVELPINLALVATRDGGPPMLVEFQGHPAAASAAWGKTRVLANSTIEMGQTVHGSAVENGWFSDSTLSQPGRIRLQAWLGSYPDRGTVPSEGLASNIVLLEINEPTDVDRKIWERMMTVGHGDWVPGLTVSPAGREIARDVLTNMPQSTYAGWLATAGAGNDSAESAQLLRSWLTRTHNDQYTEWRHLRLAWFEEGAARYWGEIKPQESAAHKRAARLELKHLQNALDPEVAARAAERLVEIDKLDEVVEQ